MSKKIDRPDPDLLLKRIEADAQKARRGKVKIFFGSSAGVGKTYAMLLAAHEQLREGVDVVVGIVETHQRPETKTMLVGLPGIPSLQVPYRDVVLAEFDLDGAKLRKPDILLVDELAHTNAPGLRHPKRWNDVEELLDAGIDVYTTLNVQHLESLNDIVAGITGVWVKETVADAVFDKADDIVLVDIDADKLLKRLREGKVYIATEAKNRAAEHFFRKSNLIALRELALRRTAERVDAQMNAYHTNHGASEHFPVAEKILVCIGPDPLSTKLVRTAKRMAASLKAPWVALYVENLRHYRLNAKGRQAVETVTRMAERMAGQTVVLQGNNVVDEIMAYARQNQITKIIVGKSIKAQWRNLLFGTLADKIIRQSGTIDVYVVTGNAAAKPEPLLDDALLDNFQPLLYGWSFLVAAICTAIGILAHNFLNNTDQALIFLSGIVVVAAKFGRGPSLLYSLLSVSAYNFFFVEPLYTFAVSDRSYWMTFSVMIITGAVIASQASRLRWQAFFARRREHDTQILYRLTRELASTRGREKVCEVAARHIAEMLKVEVTIWLPDQEGHLAAQVGTLPAASQIKDSGVLQWCFDHAQIAGKDTTTMPTALGLYVPLVTMAGTLGVLGVIPATLEYQFSVDERASLDTLASLLASAIERVNAAAIAEHSKVEAESERLRSTLLSSVSHDLRTPLASITGASSSIVLELDRLPSNTVRELAQSIHREATRLSRIVTNLLDVTTLESGTVKLNQQPYFIDEIIGAALTQVEAVLHHHKIVTDIVADLPMVLIDGMMIEQVLVNLLENAGKYTPEHTTITVAVTIHDNKVMVTVSDEGPGIPVHSEQKIFDKFYTIARDVAHKGTGLGLAICSGIIRLHGGAIQVTNKINGGAAFSFSLPLADPQMIERSEDQT